MNINDYSKVTDRIEPSERCRNEVLNMNKRQKKHIKLSKRSIAAVAAVAVAACGGTAVYAAEKFGVFSRLSDTLSGSYVDERGNEWQKDKFEQFDFSNLDHEAKTFDAPIPLDGEDISLTVESVYCDGRTLIFGVSGSLNNGNPEGYQYIPLSTYLKRNGKTYSTFYRDEKVILEYSKLYLEEGTENNFTGTVEYVFGDEHQMTEAEDVELKLMEFKPNSNIYGTPDGILGCDTPSLNDTFVFDVKVEPDKSSIRTIDHEFVDSEGYSVCIMDINPTAMEVQCWTTPEEWEEHEDPYKKAHPDVKVSWEFSDENGKKLDFIGLTGRYQKDDGRYASLVQAPSTDIIKVTYRDTSIYDENGEYKIVHETTIDLKNMTVIE